MEFDKSKVYTAVNADELKFGSKVILATNLESLRYKVNANSWPTYVKEITDIMGPSSTDRFKAGDKTYNLAYFVSEPKEKWIVYLSRESGHKPRLSKCRENKWRYKENICGAKTQLFIGNEEEADNWAKQRMKFSEVIAAWEDGKQIQCYDVSEDNWLNVGFPKWDIDCRYRIKPKENVLKWTDLKIGDVIEKKGIVSYIVTGIVYNGGADRHKHIWANGIPIDDIYLESWEKAE